MSGQLKTLQDAERSLAELQRLCIELDGVTNAMEADKAAVAERFAPQLADLAGDILAERKLLNTYLDTHKADFDGPPRSVQFASGTIGYRLGQPHLKPLSKWTWEKVLKALVAAKAERYFRVQVREDREALMADAETLGAEGLREIGLRVTQDDKAFVEVNREPEPAGGAV
jgi:phage host-nuclease inhibitor protein Gam